MLELLAWLTFALAVYIAIGGDADPSQSAIAIDGVEQAGRVTLPTEAPI